MAFLGSLSRCQLNPILYLVGDIPGAKPGMEFGGKGQRLLAIIETCGDEISTEDGSVGGREGPGVRDSREGELKGLQTGDKNWS